MEIIKNIEIVDLALLINKKILLLSDLHIGYESYLRNKGVLIPNFQFNDIVKRLELILNKTKPKTIVITGDLKHEFGTISNQEWKNILKLLDLLMSYTKKIILIKGNHDHILDVIAKKRDLAVKEKYKIKDIMVLHGDHLTDFKDVKTIIIGHEHPAIRLKKGVRSELFKCFLKGKFKRKNLIIMPSFNPLTIGSDVKKGNLGPFKINENFEVFVVEDKVYNFGKIKNI